MKGLCAEGALTKDAWSGRAVAGGEMLPPLMRRKGGLGVKSWVQRRNLAEMDAVHRSPQGRLRGGANTLISSPPPLTLIQPIDQTTRILGGSQS